MLLAGVAGGVAGQAADQDDTGDIAFGPPRDLILKGFSEPRRLHGVIWHRGV